MHQKYIYVILHLQKNIVYKGPIPKTEDRNHIETYPPPSAKKPPHIPARDIIPWKIQIKNYVVMFKYVFNYV